MITQDQINNAIKSFMLRLGFSHKHSGEEWNGQDHQDFRHMMTHKFNVPLREVSVPTKLEHVHPEMAEHPEWRTALVKVGAVDNSQEQQRHPDEFDLDDFAVRDDKGSEKPIVPEVTPAPTEAPKVEAQVTEAKAEETTDGIEQDKQQQSAADESAAKE